MLINSEIYPEFFNVVYTVWDLRGTVVNKVDKTFWLHYGSIVLGTNRQHQVSEGEESDGEKERRRWNKRGKILIY